MKALLARRVAETGVWREDGSRNAAVWLSTQTGSTVGAAQQVLETARALEELPATEAAFRSGELSAVQAAEITSAAVEAPDSEHDLLDAARSTSVKGLRDRAREVRAGAQEDDAAWARRQHDRRYGRVWTDPEGSVRVEGSLPPETGARFKAAFEVEVDRIFKEARQAGAARDPRRLRRRRARRHGRRRSSEAGQPRRSSSTPPRSIAATCSTVSGARSKASGPSPSRRRAGSCRTASISLLVRDGDDLTAVSRPVRTIPTKLRRELTTAYPVCGVRGCANDRFLEIDHVIPVCAGGETSKQNCWRICPHHHFLKHHRGWRVTGEPGSWNLVPPDGHARATLNLLEVRRGEGAARYGAGSDTSARRRSR